MPRGNLTRPPELAPSVDVSGLVDVETGLLDRAIFTDEQLYLQELRRVFATELAVPGARRTSSTSPATSSRPTWARTRSSSPCDKRQAAARLPQLVPPPRRPRLPGRLGATRNFTCTYHGWSYDLEGNWSACPTRPATRLVLDTEDWGLVEVPHVQTYRGLVFGTWNPQPAPLTESLGEHGLVHGRDARPRRRGHGRRRRRPQVGARRQLEARGRAVRHRLVPREHEPRLGAHGAVARRARRPRTRSCTAPAASTSTRRATAPASRCTPRTGSTRRPCTSRRTTTLCGNASVTPGWRAR